jgi:hypothetical protein
MLLFIFAASKVIPMKRTGGGFVAPNLLLSSTAASSAKSTGRSPYVEDEEEDVFFNARQRKASQGRPSSSKS